MVSCSPELETINISDEINKYAAPDHGKVTMNDIITFKEFIILKLT